MKSVSGKSFCKILERHGWRLARIRGSHYIYEKDGVETIAVVPVHANRDLRLGTLKNTPERYRIERTRPLIVSRQRKG